MVNPRDSLEMAVSQNMIRMDWRGQIDLQ
jgi:hypothetical protein